MENFSSPDFWLDQLTAAFIAWAIVIPLILVFWAILKIRLARMKKEMHRLQADTEAIKSPITIGP